MSQDQANATPPDNCGVAEQPLVGLPPICWLHGPHELRREVDQGIDYCPECVRLEVSEHQAKYPEHASEIFADGGYEQFRFSDSAAMCYRCNCELSCTVEINGETHLIETFDDWCNAL